MYSEKYRIEVNGYSVRTEMYQGQRHIVVPVVMMVEGVHNGSAGALYHPASELSKFPSAWNGIPVVIEHPTMNGTPISANNPKIAENKVIGRVYNTKFEDNKLKGEAWLNESKLKQKYPLAAAYIMQQKPIDVSLGMYSEDEPKEGEWNGEKYIGIAHNYRPDHLALLPGGVGACSWEDGCGIRTNDNEGGEDNGMKVYLKYSGTETGSWSAPTLGDFGVKKRWSELSSGERSRIADHYLIGNGEAKTFEDLKLPVVNPKTGKLNERALRAVISGRGSQIKGISKTIIDKARKRAYNLLNSEFDAKLKIPETFERGDFMGKDKKIKELIAMSAYEDKDAEWIGSLEDEQLDKLIANAKEAEEIKDALETNKAEAKKRVEEIEALKNKIAELQKGTPQINEEAAMKFLEGKISDVKVFSKLLPEEMKQQFEYGQKLYQEHRKELINRILTNQAQKVWDEDSLQKMDDRSLQKIADSIKPIVDYSAAGGGFDKTQPEEILLPVGVKVNKDKEA